MEGCSADFDNSNETAVAGPVPSLLVFWRKLKTHLFRQSYPDIIL